MKIRTGFVSNSSSSSYVMLVKEDHWNEVYNSMPKCIQDIVNEIGYEKKKCFGDDFISCGYMSGNYSDFEDISGVDDEDLTEEDKTKLNKLINDRWEGDNYYAEELFNAFENALGNDSDKIFTYSVDDC